MPRRYAVVIFTFILALSGCASVRGQARANLLARTRLLVSNPTQYPVKVYASRTPDQPGWRLGRLAIGGSATYTLPYSGDVFFRIVRLNGRMVMAQVHITPGDVVELEPNQAWDYLYVTVRPRP